MPSIGADTLPDNSTSPVPVVAASAPSVGPVAMPQADSNSVHARIYHAYHSPPYYYPQHHQQPYVTYSQTTAHDMAASPLSSGYATAVA
ncbi:hypothetical protein LPJ74_006509, partial [Coemansia sp. RSA 1843]